MYSNSPCSCELSFPLAQLRTLCLDLTHDRPAALERIEATHWPTVRYLNGHLQGMLAPVPGDETKPTVRKMQHKSERVGKHATSTQLKYLDGGTVP